MTHVRAAAILTERLGRLAWEDLEAVALRCAIKRLLGTKTWVQADELLQQEFQRMEAEADAAAR
jgi:hypothetical protein